ncbi:hypothetical protein [Paraburkholderia strydomiana]|uniref:hypothetical protein n=1 Tax=Paraburkholderia strydomiana TaxID=1245417 RepID=UPI001BEB2D4A|nr:hypothetical protein [Paraburkholderia strydomiana]MBT2795338.1 hypothetical protein [Paraburkholderia strydomiana]
MSAAIVQVSRAIPVGRLDFFFGRNIAGAHYMRDDVQYRVSLEELALHSRNSRCTAVEMSCASTSDKPCVHFEANVDHDHVALLAR